MIPRVVVRCAVLGAFASLAAFTGSCKATTLSCERVSERNAVCADAFVTYAKDKARAQIDERIAALPPAARAEADRRMQQRFDKAAAGVRETLTSNEFLDDCRASWNDPKKMPDSLKRELQRCIDLPDCDGYAACFMEAEQTSRPDGG